MITKDKITEIFCIADDFCKEFDAEIAKLALQEPDGIKNRKRKWRLTRSLLLGASFFRMEMLNCFSATLISSLKASSRSDSCASSFFRRLISACKALTSESPVFVTEDADLMDDLLFITTCPLVSAVKLRIHLEIIDSETGIIFEIFRPPIFSWI